MAAGLWAVYYSAKKHIGDGAIDLDNDDFIMSLYTSTSNAATLTLDTKAQLTNEVAEGFGYSQLGLAMTGVTWGDGASAAAQRFNAEAVEWIATGGNIQNILYAVISKVGATPDECKLLCVAQLADVQFTVTTGTPLIVGSGANGIFELT
jgi:hypothetical protein